MDNNNQPNIKIPEQPPINSIPPTPKKLSKIIIAIIVLAIVVVAVGLLAYKKQSPVSTNLIKQPLIENKIYSVKEINDLFQTSPESFKNKTVQLKAYRVDNVGGTGCHDYTILTDHDYVEIFKNRYDSKLTAAQQKEAQELAKQAPVIYSGMMLSMPKEIFPTQAGIYEGHFYDSELQKMCDDGEKRFVIEKKIEELQITSEAPSVNQNATNQSNITVPPLFTNVKWQEMPFDSSKTMDFQMAYDDFKYVQEPAKRKQKIIQLPGHLWIATIKNLSDSQLNDTREKFQKYYDDSLKVSGWDWQQDLDNKHISFSGPAADGALGSIWGYVKIQNEKLRLIGLGYQIKDYTDVSDGGPIEIKCPCTLELKVFESDEVNVNNYSL